MLQYAWVGVAAADIDLFPDLPTVLWTVVDFVILLWGLTRLLYKPLMKKVQDHEQAVDASSRRADADRDAAAKSRSEKELELAAAKRQAAGIVAVANREAELMRTRAEEDAKRQADAILAEAAAAVAIDRQQVTSELHNEAAELVVLAAGRIIADFLGSERQRGLWDATLSEVAKLRVDDDVPATISVEVRSALALSLDEQRELTAGLSERLNRQVRLEPVVAPELIGGIAVLIGDHLVDGSVQAQLRRLYQHLTGAVWRWDNEHPSQ